MPRTSHWRTAAINRINEVGDRLIEENPEASLEWIRREISKAYPFGRRENYPYQVWLEELNNYMDSLKPEPTSLYCSDQPVPPKTWKRREPKPIKPVEGQLNLFDSQD